MWWATCVEPGSSSYSRARVRKGRGRGRGRAGVGLRSGLVRVRTRVGNGVRFTNLVVEPVEDGTVRAVDSEEGAAPG